MRKRGSVLGVVFYSIVFLLIFTLVLGKFMGIGIGMAIASGAFDGFSEFLLRAIPLFIFLGLLIFLVAGAYMAGGSA